MRVHVDPACNPSSLHVVWCAGSHVPPPHSVSSALHGQITRSGNVYLCVVDRNYKARLWEGGLGTDTGCAGCTQDGWKVQFTVSNANTASLPYK